MNPGIHMKSNAPNIILKEMFLTLHIILLVYSPSTSNGLLMYLHTKRLSSRGTWLGCKKIKIRPKHCATWYTIFAGCKRHDINIICTDYAKLLWINRGYYMAARRNIICLRVLKNLSQVSAVTELNIFEFFSISKQTCNVLCTV